MPKLPRVTAKQMLRALRDAGWEVVRQQGGSHAQLRHPEKPARRVTLAAHAGETLSPFIVKSILDQAGMTAEELRDLL